MIAAKEKGVDERKEKERYHHTKSAVGAFL